MSINYTDLSLFEYEPKFFSNPVKSKEGRIASVVWIASFPSIAKINENLRLIYPPV